MLTYFTKKISLPFELPTSIYGSMLIIWMINPGLQKRYPLHKNQKKHYLAYLSWCCAVGRDEYKILTEIKAWNAELSEPVDLPSLRGDIWTGCMNKAMYLVGLHRAQGQQSLFKSSPVLRHSVARWFFREGALSLSLDNVSLWQQKAIKKQFKTPEVFANALMFQFEQSSPETLTRLYKIAHQIFGKMEPDEIESEFKTRNAPPSFSLKDRVVTKFALKFIKLFNLARRFSYRYLGTWEPSREDFQRLTVSLYEETLPAQSKQNQQKKFYQKGINLFGYAKGELGIGEDVRTIALSLAEVGVPFCVINIKLGDNVSQADESISQWIVSEPKYDINIFCMTAIEHTRFVAQQGSSWINNCYNIGVWPWELPDWPTSWHHVYQLVDEIWGISAFTAHAYRNSARRIEVMPLPVIVESTEKNRREQWGLPTSVYLFMFSFDMNSTVSRKNPEGLIKAFNLAFNDLTETQVGLVLKVSHSNANNPRWKALLSEIQHNPKIYLIEGSYRKKEVLGLYQCCNCFVSLHRSEGFGRSIAEAQILGLDTIATNFSGNVDFCQPPTKQVNYTLVDLEEQDYFLAGGQFWAEPSISHAAQLMHQAYQEQSKIKPQYHTNRFTISYCGQRYKKRLQEIWKKE